MGKDEYIVYWAFLRTVPLSLWMESFYNVVVSP